MKRNCFLRPLFTLGLVLVVVLSHAQLSVNSGVTATQLMQALLGNGLQVSNVTINCAQGAYGSFNNGSTTNLGLNNGIILSTGAADSIPGINSASFVDVSTCFSSTSCTDVDLTALDPNNAHEDCCVLEFDLIPSCDTLSIRFVFGSEEYPVFVNSFNDLFGFFITGPNPSGPAYSGTNIATLPNGQYVSINNVNNGNSNTGPCVNCAYYVDNTNGTTIRLNDFTTVLTTSIGLVPCQTYHFKIAIADAVDCYYDSSVFVDFVQCSTAFTYTTNSLPDQCNSCNGTADVTVAGGNPPYTYTWLPTGGNGPSASNLCAGTYSVVIADASSCGIPDTAVITVPSQGTLASTNTTQNILCNGSCTGSIGLTPSGGTGPYTFAWTPNVTSGGSASSLCAGSYSVVVTDQSGCSNTFTFTITEPNALAATTSTVPQDCSPVNGTATANPSGGTGPYTYLWSNGQTTQVAGNLAQGNYSVTITDANGCTLTQSVVVGMVIPPTALASASPPTIITGNSSQLSVTGGNLFSWTPATDLSCSNCSNPIASPQSTTTFCVTVSDTATGCMDSTCVVLNVDEPCSSRGLDKMMPNAFSPNNDGKNDEYCIPYNPCILHFQLKIFDRWGEMVFATTDMRDCWDGMYKGENLNNGVYAYYLDAELSTGEVFHQQGNISLVR